MEDFEEAIKQVDDREQKKLEELPQKKKIISHGDNNETYRFNSLFFVPCGLRAFYL